MQPGLLAILAFGGLFFLMAVLPTQLRKYHRSRDREQGLLRQESEAGKAAD